MSFFSDILSFADDAFNFVGDLFTSDTASTVGGLIKPLASAASSALSSSRGSQQSGGINQSIRLSQPPGAKQLGVKAMGDATSADPSPSESYHSFYKAHLDRMRDFALLQDIAENPSTTSNTRSV